MVTLQFIHSKVILCDLSACEAWITARIESAFLFLSVNKTTSVDVK